MRYTFIAIVFALFVKTSTAQVPLNSIVEHFTNTKCGNCTSRNPGFYTNLNSKPAIFHLSIHPSSPYAACQLSQQNKVDNDSRTNYYGVYGATPRLVINGNVIAEGANYSSASLLTPYTGLTSSFQLKVTQFLVSPDSIRSTVIIKKVASSTASNTSLFIGLVEDTIAFNGGNGEPKHYNVLRKSVSTSTGIAVVLPTAIDDSIIIIRTSFIKPIWNKNRMYTLAILQDMAKKVLQSNKSMVLSSVTGIEDLSAREIFQVYPNPTTDIITISMTEKTPFAFEIFDIAGKMVKSGQMEGNISVNVSSLKNGFYAVRVFNSNTSGKSVFSIQK